MISKLNNDLENAYNKSLELLNKLGLKEESWEVLFMIILIKEDSLINCLLRINIEEYLSYIKDNQQQSSDIYKEILTLAYEICQKDKEIFIGDEHILYAFLNVNDDNIKNMFTSLKINIPSLNTSVLDYFEFDDDEYLVDLSYLAKINKFNPFIGRSEYIDKIIRIISKKQKNNCLLIGSAGVGKSALVEGVVMELISKHIDITVYRLELGVIIAGTRYRGDLEERLVNVIKKVKREKAILFIDEIHNIVGGSKGEDAINIANILKPILARSEIKCIGATTVEEYYDFIEKDKALARRFQTIFIPEATEEETLKILKKIKYKYEDFYKITYSNEILSKIIKTCIYFPNKKYPDKAIDILDELGAYTVSIGLKKPRVKDVKKITFENIGLRPSICKKINYPEFNTYYNIFTNQIMNTYEKRKTIMNIYYTGQNSYKVIEDIKKLYNIRDEAIIKIEFELFDENTYNYLIKCVLKYPLVCIILENFESGQNIYYLKVKKAIETGQVFDNNGRIVSFKNSIFVINDKSKKEIIGFNDCTEIKASDFYDLKINDNIMQIKRKDSY